LTELSFNGSQANGSLPQIARRILDAMVAAVDPQILVRRAVQRSGDQLNLNGIRIDLAHYHQLHCLGAGKAAAAMAAGLLPRIHDRVYGGVVITPRGVTADIAPVSRLNGDHPLPGHRSRAATRALLRYVDQHIGSRDLVFFLLSGGASSLLAAPPGGISTRRWHRLNRQLLFCGAPIAEVNRVRAMYSQVKGGRLARRIFPAALWTLAISDVIGSSPGTIGSAPTVAAATPDLMQARAICRRYGLSCDLSLLNNPHPPFDDGPFPPGGYHLVGDNRTALEAGCMQAAAAGFPAAVLTTRLQGAVEAAAQRLSTAMRRFRGARPPRAWVFGGETTVRVRGNGRGGRNQELVLRLLSRLRDLPGPWCVACMGSDGIDGNSPAAGAWISHESAGRLCGLESALERALENNDSHRFFRRFGGLVGTGPTGTNVMDLGVILMA
jgi:glycerate-2-kinase